LLLKNIYIYIIYLPFIFFCFRDVKTKDKYIGIYIFQVAMFLNTGISMYLFIYLLTYLLNFWSLVQPVIRKHRKLHHRFHTDPVMAMSRAEHP